MAPQTSKRLKGIQIFRPFIYGTTALPFHPVHNPKPPGVPEDHTHSWTVFVKGIDDVDITYWLRRVQFKLHESIPNHVRMVEGEKGKPFVLHETGWGEFEIAIKLYYVPESSEKPQTLYHHLRLHPYGRTDEEKENMRLSNNGEVISWSYEEQLFNEPYEAFYEILTSGAMPTPGSQAQTKSTGGKGGKSKEKDEKFAVTRSEGGVLDRSAMIPLFNRPGQMFSRETEQVEIKKLKEAMVKIEEMARKTREEMEKKEKRLKELKADAAKA
ncbi:protein AF-9 [Cladorrhinum sp. PSN259]|nr:protein AF-9 [Cladorrhinum sp. PSN259]